MASEEYKTIPVTVIIPVKNEASVLRSCLEPLSQMDDVVVVDSGSDDGTANIAQRWGAHVVQFKWNGGFPKKRNWILQTYPFCTEWVLFLDADEVLTSDFVRELRVVIASTEYACYWIKYTNHFQGRQLRFGVAQRKLALFRVGSGHYERIEDPGWSNLDMEVHEHPILNGPVGSMHCRITHNDYKDLYGFIERHNKYSTWEASRYMARPAEKLGSRAARTLRQRAKYALAESTWLSVLYFLYTYLFLGGILDGRTGLHYAIYKAIYFFDISQKIRELKRSKSGSLQNSASADCSDRDHTSGGSHFSSL